MEEQSIERIRQVIVEAVCRAVQNREAEKEKPEHMTHLRGDVLVCKDHPRIAFRGSIDSLEAEIIQVQVKAAEKHQDELYRDLDEIIKTIRHLLRCEVSGEAVECGKLQGLNTDELRAHSHHPSRYYGMKHFLPTAEHGEMVGYLNRLRTKARETELAAYRAFKEEDGSVSREDILTVLNRLSSLFWIMMFKYLTGEYENTAGWCQAETKCLAVDACQTETKRLAVDACQAEVRGQVEVEASGRHVHLCRRDVEALFGQGYQLTRARELSQPGQYVCRERISVTGPKGTIHNVVVLGPERKETQVEVSFTDGLTLGLKPPVRLSGEIKDSPGAVLSWEGRQIVIEQGVIVAKRHMHVAAADAACLNVKDGENLSIEVLGSRPVVFKDTVARVSKNYKTYVHIDYDEANACGFEKGMKCRIVR